MAVKLIIFEDNEKLRKSLIGLFQYSEKYLLLGTFPNVLDAGNVLKEHLPDVVLLDIDMPGMNGIAAIPIIKEAHPMVSVIMYTQFEDDNKLFDSLCAGADGYILKNTAPLRIFDFIEEVRNGGLPLSPAVAGKVLEFFRGKKKRPEEKYGLTQRESEVLQLLVKGYSIKLIASKLNIAFDTSRSHLRNIYNKLHVNCGKEAIAKVLAEKIKIIE